MLFAYMISAVVTAIVCTGVWLLAGGGWLAAVLVYVLSGNLAIFGVAGYCLFRSRA